MCDKIIYVPHGCATGYPVVQPAIILLVPFFWLEKECSLTQGAPGSLRSHLLVESCMQIFGPLKFVLDFKQVWVPDFTSTP